MLAMDVGSWEGIQQTPAVLKAAVVTLPKATVEVWITNLALGILRKLQGKVYPTITHLEETTLTLLASWQMKERLGKTIS